MNEQGTTAQTVDGGRAEGSLLDWLMNPVNYAQNLVSVDGKSVRLDEWQARYLRDESKFINILKSRRVGGSWVMTLKMFIRSQLAGEYRGTFISMNLEEATGKIEYADRLFESLPRRFKKKRIARSKTEIVFEDSMGRRAILKSLASKAPRGKGGDVGISELPHCRNSREIYEGALHVTSRSTDDRLTIESTPMGKGGVFYDISKGKMPHFTLYEVPWWHSNALCADVKRATEEAPILSTRRRVESFGTPSMRAIFASMDEAAFRQESELEFVEAEECAFPIELLHKNSSAAFGDHPEAEHRFKSLKRIPSGDEWCWLSKNAKGELFAGYDVGRKKDESVLFIMDSVGGCLEARMMVRLEKAGFADQESVMAESVKHGVRRIAIDSTGIGLPVAEKMESMFGDSVMPVHFTAQIKARLVSNTKMLLSDGKMLLPLERNVIQQMRSIEKKISGSGNVVFTSPKGADHHADIAWALMLAAHAAAGQKAQNVYYERVTKRNSWRW